MVKAGFQAHETRSPSLYRVNCMIYSLDIPVQIQKVLDIMGLDLVGTSMSKPLTASLSYDHKCSPFGDLTNVSHDLKLLSLVEILR